MPLPVRAFWLLLGIAVCCQPAQAQTNPLRGGSADRAAEPDPTMQPATPVLVPRVRQLPDASGPARNPSDQAKAAQPQMPQPPFVLAPHEQAQVEQVLRQWERRNQEIKTFDCRFKRWSYNVTTVAEPNRPNAPRVELGVIKYAAPDRGLFRIEQTEQDGREVPVEEAFAQHWICDGKSIFEFSPAKKQVIEHKLPAELQGKAIADGPLPFLFGADADKLKQRYFLRLLPPPGNAPDQICIEAYPRHPREVANFHHAQLILKKEGMTPFGLMLVEPNGKDYKTYQFYDIVVNDPLRLFKGDPFRPHTPLGWMRLVEEAPDSTQARQPAAVGPR